MIVYGKATFENCVFRACNLSVNNGGEVIFVGYCNTFLTTINSSINANRNSKITGQITAITQTYGDPGEFKKGGIHAHTGSKVESTNSRILWTAFGAIAEGGSQIICDNLLVLNSYRDGIVNRASSVYSNNCGVKRGTAGYCVYSEAGATFIPNNCLANGGGSTTGSGTTLNYSTATDDEE